MYLPSEVQEVINRNKTKDLIGDIMYIMMRDLHLSYREIKKMPLCDLLNLLDRWNKEQKETKKMLDKSKRRK